APGWRPAGPEPVQGPHAAGLQVSVVDLKSRDHADAGRAWPAGRREAEGGKKAGPVADPPAGRPAARPLPGASKEQDEAANANPARPARGCTGGWRLASLLRFRGPASDWPS